MTHGVFVKLHDAKKKAFEKLRDEIEQDAKKLIYISNQYMLQKGRQSLFDNLKNWLVV
jgi:hypothetical protein